MNPTPRRRLLCLAAAAALLAALAACESKLTHENFDKVQPGMTMAQVQAILGTGAEDSAPPGFEISGAGAASTRDAPADKMYVWTQDGITIVITFNKGVVVAKQASGL